MRSPRRWLARPIVAAMLIALAAPVLDAPATASPVRAPGGGDLRNARALVDGARHALASESFSELLASAGIAPAPDVTTGSASPVRALSSSVQRASRLIRAAVPSRLDARYLRRSFVASHLIRARGHLGALAPAVSAQIDRAAATVASALDTLLPQLRTFASRTPPAVAGTPTQGCDVVDQAPALCVAGPGDNVITKDYALVLDLGGNDVHANSAGGADTLDSNLPVSVTVDLGGNDRYETPTPTASGSAAAQGSAFLGVGFLVDAAGDDTYRVASQGDFAWAEGQGDALHGVGVLADLGGDDTYGIAASGHGTIPALGQGHGADGVGILLDAGGDDAYSISSTATGFFEDPSGFAIHPPVAVSIGDGMGEVGFINGATPAPVHVDFSYAGRGYGLLADGGGVDTLDVDARTPDPQRDDLFGQFVLGIPGAVSLGVGYGESGGAGLVVLGDGDTESTVSATALTQRSGLESEGIGFATGGVGVVSDLGGDDTRRLSGDIAIQRGAEISDGCPEPCDTPGAGAASFDADVSGLGAAPGAGTGWVDDRGSGADHYSATGSNVVETTVDDARGNPSGAAGLSYATAGPVHMTVQGAGENFGSGILSDEGGNDRYEIAATSVAHAIVTRRGNAPEPEAHSKAGDVTVVGQGSARSFGYGSLADLGGSDTYVSSSSAGSQADPPFEVVNGTATTGVLASVDAGSGGSFVDIDNGMADQVTTSPATPACTGTRGQGVWVDCGGAGTGIMA